MTGKLLAMMFAIGAALVTVWLFLDEPLASQASQASLATRVAPYPTSPQRTVTAPQPLAAATAVSPSEMPGPEINDDKPIRAKSTQSMASVRTEGFLEFARNGLGKLEIECSPDIYGEEVCSVVPGTSLDEHPYFSYPTESLEALPGEPIAQQVLAMRFGGESPELGFAHAIKAVGLSNGKPGPLIEFLQSSDWVITAVNGEPALDSLRHRYVIEETAVRLGHTLADSSRTHSVLAEHLTTAQLTELDREVEEVLEAIRAIDPAREYMDPG